MIYILGVDWGVGDVKFLGWKHSHFEEKIYLILVEIFVYVFCREGRGLNMDNYDDDSNSITVFKKFGVCRSFRRIDLGTKIRLFVRPWQYLCSVNKDSLVGQLWNPFNPLHVTCDTSGCDDTSIYHLLMQCKLSNYMSLTWKVENEHLVIFMRTRKFVS